MRVHRSAIGSVIMFVIPLGWSRGWWRSPGGLAHAGDLALVRGGAQADAADAELAVDGTLAAALQTTRVAPRLELGLGLRFVDPGQLGHASALLARRLLFFARLERQAELLEQRVAALAGSGRGAESDVPALRELHLVQFDLGHPRLLHAPQPISATTSCLAS